MYKFSSEKEQVNESPSIESRAPNAVRILHSGRIGESRCDKGGPYFGKDGLFVLLHNCLPVRAVARSAFLFCQK